jgi:sulfur carrier protein ThiS adenylyltransferase
VTVIGVGSIGRQVALQLAAMGLPAIQLIDPDSVEAANLGCQGYRMDDLGQVKVAATADLCHQLHPAMDIQMLHERFRKSMDTGTAIFCCVDSIETRRFIWRAVRDHAAFFTDGRMSAEVLRVLTACDLTTRRHYPTTLFPGAEAHAGPCTARSTIYCANIAAGLMVAQFAKFIRGLPVEADIQLNLLAGEWTVQGCM